MGALRPRQRLGYRGCHCEPASQRRCGNPPDIPGTLIGFVDDALIVLPHTPSTYAIGAMRASPPTSSIRRLPQSALIRLALAGDARVTFPRGECFGKRIATPVCGLVRNDKRYTTVRQKCGTASMAFLLSSRYLTPKLQQQITRGHRKMRCPWALLSLNIPGRR